MAWVYLDDKFPRHPKVMAAMSLQPLAPWLFVCGLAYCREHLNGGMMGKLVVPTLMPLYRPKMFDALVTVNLWERSGDGEWVTIHDYEFWNQTEDHQREARSEKARKAATIMWEQKRLAQLNARAGA